MPKTYVPEADEIIPMGGFNNYLLSILDENDSPPRRPFGVSESNHKRITFGDFDDTEIGKYPQFIFPEACHIEEVFKWVDTIIKDEPDNIIIHCFAGISRSTATAFSIICKLMGPNNEEEALSLLLKHLPRSRAYPNQRIVRLASEILDAPKMNDVIEEFKNPKDRLVF